MQFNQVITFTGALNGFSCTSTSTLGTVPNGKVWKIEFVGGKRSSSTGYEDGLIVNGQSVSINVNSTTRTFPIWLKSGDQIAYYGCGPIVGGGNTSTTTSYLISIIEFNIVP